MFLYTVMKGIIFLCHMICIILASNCCYGEDVLNDVVTAIEKAINFYKLNYAEMNIDGIFGLRVIEGQLQLVTSFLKSNSAIPDSLQSIYTRLEKAYREASYICKLSVKFLKESDSSYYQLMNKVIQRRWSFWRSYRNIDPKLKWGELTPDKGTLLDERVSDRCMSELMGNDKIAPCSISNECVTTMSSAGKDGYFITHQLLYTMLAERSGCLDILNNKLQHLPDRLKSVGQLQAEFCANNFFETSKSVILQKGVIKPLLQDLFLEQELVCSMLGYIEFLHVDWLRQILSWQMMSGCFGENDQIESEVKPLVRQKSGGSINIGQQALNIMGQEAAVPMKKPIPVGYHDKSGSLIGAVPVLAGFSPKQMPAGFNSNARKSRFNDSRILKADDVDAERESFGRRHHKPVLARESVYTVHHEQGRVGETQVKVNEEHDPGKLIFKHGPENDDPAGIVGEESRQINRKLLYEKSLKDGCLAHKTAVAMGALSQYVRFLLVANSSGFDPLKHLFGTNYLMQPDSLLSLTAAAESKAVAPAPNHQKAMLSSPRQAVNKDLDAKHGKSLVFESDRHQIPSHRKITVKHTTRPTVTLPAFFAQKPRKTTDELEKGLDYDIGKTDFASPVSAIPKSQDDELLLYDDLVNFKPRVEATDSKLSSNEAAVKASHMQTSGDAGFEGVGSISSTYAFVVIITACILLLLYRSLRKHRITSRYGRWR